ncbi:MAG: hypothetical protein QMD86_01000 [Patescibacteria group bacterium]|nr:hypothetical protein [Patescibacteria group bacterium]
MTICIQPGCGYVFPSGMQISGKCPNCDKNPFKLSPNSTYTAKEFEGRKILTAPDTNI